MKRHPVRFLIIVILLTSAATIMALRLDIVPGLSEKEAPRPAFAFAPAGQVTLSSDEEINIRVYSQVSPGVVNITKTVMEYEWFWAPYPTEAEETGSGCILDTEGNVLTNYHVVRDADRLEVSLPDQSKYSAKTIGFDEQNDLAVIKLDNAPKNRLHPIALGDSAILKVGQKVLAIGNPLGLQNTLTVGIVSSLGRRIKTESGDLVDNVIQTDAAINPGNSGGPLLNTAGEMIGINTSIFTIRGGGNIGIGFAIPSNTIRRVATQLIRYGHVVRAWFGVRGYDLGEELASALDLPVSSGVLVAVVERGSSADKGGIQGYSKVVRWYNQRLYVGGDIITAIDGKAVSSNEEIRLELESKRPGETVKVTLYHNGSKIEKSVLLVEAPSRHSTSL
jgi:S1-C subfamily serine protease